MVSFPRSATLDLAELADASRLYAEPTRLRLLNLLGREELTVAELTAATGLSQSRVSTHLARLRDAGVLRQRRAGTRTFVGLDEAGRRGAVGRLWEQFREELSDAQLEQDRQRLDEVLAARQESWADAVAGRMERHYSPGRTWEAATRGLLGLLQLGRVLDVASGDGALAELLAPRARSVTCLDRSERVLAAAGRRFRHLPQVELLRGDMHALPFAAASFDQVLLVNSLSYAEDPAQVIGEAARVLRPGGRLVAVTLAAHTHERVARAYGHRRMGFEPQHLHELFARKGFDVELCAPTSRERRPPRFAVLSLHARRHAADPTAAGVPA